MARSNLHTDARQENMETAKTENDRTYPGMMENWREILSVTMDFRRIHIICQPTSSAIIYIQFELEQA